MINNKIFNHKFHQKLLKIIKFYKKKIVFQQKKKIPSLTICKIKIKNLFQFKKEKLYFIIINLNNFLNNFQ